MSGDGTRAVLVYRDLMLPFSETFVLRQAEAMRRHAPILVGRRSVGGVDLAGREAMLVNQGGAGGFAREAAFLAGFPPRRLVDDLRARSPVLLHAHFGPDAVNALPLGQRLGLPLVVTFHGYDATQRVTLRSGAWAWRYARRRPRLAQGASRIVAVSEHIARRLTMLGFPEDRVTVHYIGIDPTRFVPAPLEAREPIVLGVGRFVEKKGFDVLIDAMARVQASAPDAQLVLVGSGPLRERLEARAAALLRSYRIVGPCDAAEVAAWMRRARVLAVPSVTSRSGDTEGLPITLLEGMASGLGVVATRHAGIPEAVSDGVSGLLVEERDAATLAGRIVELLRDDDGWRELSAGARAVVEARFDIATQTSRLEDLYLELT